MVSCPSFLRSCFLFLTKTNTKTNYYIFHFVHSSAHPLFHVAPCCCCLFPFTDSCWQLAFIWLIAGNNTKKNLYQTKCLVKFEVCPTCKFFIRHHCNLPQIKKKKHTSPLLTLVLLSSRWWTRAWLPDNPPKYTMYSNGSMLEQHGNLMKWVQLRRKDPRCDWGNHARV